VDILFCILFNFLKTQNQTCISNTYTLSQPNKTNSNLCWPVIKSLVSDLEQEKTSQKYTFELIVLKKIDYLKQ